mmetsp:Transcript_10527/g.15708  ORF Transcript_10527/g.15708 Transcript_10527/m.15708 type:complete len:153 (+) Transcript_10527:86-544(+)
MTTTLPGDWTLVSLSPQAPIESQSEGKSEKKASKKVENKISEQVAETAESKLIDGGNKNAKSDEVGDSSEASTGSNVNDAALETSDKASEDLCEKNVPSKAQSEKKDVSETRVKSSTGFGSLYEIIFVCLFGSILRILTSIWCTGKCMLSSK